MPTPLEGQAAGRGRFRRSPASFVVPILWVGVWGWGWIPPAWCLWGAIWGEGRRHSGPDVMVWIFASGALVDLDPQQCDPGEV